MVTVFNHRYDANLPKLDTLYGARFPGLTHLVPFYPGDAENVIPFYASSYAFQGAAAQAAAQLDGGGFTHFVFAADDLLLNPALTADSLVQELGLGDDDAYIKAMYDMGATSFEWRHWWRAVLPFSFHNATEYERELPSPEEGYALLARHGLGAKRALTLSNLRGIRGGAFLKLNDRSFWLGIAYLLRGRGRFVLRYPLVVAYSDFVVVPVARFREFARICGVFAAMGVFAEVAIPTALALSCPRIVTEDDTSWAGRELWFPEDVERLGTECGWQLDRLEQSYGDRELYIHPIKLSRWDGP